jgi:hypothetical protein
MNAKIDRGTPRATEDKARVIIPLSLDVPPEEHEIELAWILARHYQVTVEFLKPIKGYQVKTADVVMNGLIWEFEFVTKQGEVIEIK